MATFWERVAHSVNRMFSLLCLFVALAASHFGFEGGTLVLIASVPGPEVIKLFFTLNSAEHEIYLAHKC